MKALYNISEGQQQLSNSAYVFTVLNSNTHPATLTFCSKDFIIFFKEKNQDGIVFLKSG